MSEVLSEKQLEFIINAKRKINLAHGAVRSGKTMGSMYSFMVDVERCPDTQIYMIGHTSSTIYDNAVRLLLDAQPIGRPDPLAAFRPFCTWRKGDRALCYKDKVINTIGAKDSGSIGAIQGKTMSLVYCDEMTLYPDNIIDMISTRISPAYSKLIATMNPSSPSHKIKGWIDKANGGDKDYYALQFLLENNPFVDENYKQRLKHSLSGVFYRRNYLGEWCLAEGAIFDFFDRQIYVVPKPPRCAEYWIASIDYGTSNAFACLLIGCSSGQYDQTSPMMWVEKEYYWDSKVMERQKTSYEFADELKEWLAPYAVKSIYVDPSAANFKLDLQRRGMHVVDGNNDVINGIIKMISDLKEGKLFICSECTNLIREIEGYVWDSKKTERGREEPLKKNDHAIDALRYACNTHRVVNPMIGKDFWKKQNEYNQNRQYMNGRSDWKPAGDYGFR